MGDIQGIKTVSTILFHVKIYIATHFPYICPTKFYIDLFECTWSLKVIGRYAQSFNSDLILFSTHTPSLYVNECSTWILNASRVTLFTLLMNLKLILVICDI